MNTPPLILIAEDEQVYAKILALKFKEEGFEVIAVPDGKQALEAIRFRKPDIVLLDLIMPAMDGFEVIKELQSDEELKGIKVVVLSNLGQQEDINKAKAMGVSVYLVKSDVSFQQAVGEIKQLMGFGSPEALPQ